jgi:plastocyanin
MKNGWFRGVCFGSFVLLAIVVLAGCSNDDNPIVAPVAVSYSISGQVASTGSGLSGVTMALTGANSATAITDTSGNYTFTGLDNGSYTITPSRTGYTFSPTNSPRTVSGANITAVNFTATSVQAVTYSISGQVTSNVSGLSGVTMALAGASSATAITDTSGNYTFTGLDNGSYTITPSRTGFTFSPTNSPRTVSGANITAINFTTTAGPSAQIVPCPPSVTTIVTIQDFSFTPDNVTINANGIVKWTNNGPSIHTVTSGTTPTPDGVFNSVNLGTGATVCVQFLGIGTAQYFCALHPTMTGIVTVTGGDPCLGCWDY